MKFPVLKPERINGQDVCVPYEKGGDGILTRSDQRFIAFPPSVQVVPNVMSYEEMAERITNHIIGLKAMKRSELADLMFKFTHAVAQNERARITGNG